MHNGAISSFSRVKRDLCDLLPEDLFCGIQGTTDSEHIFALFLHVLGDRAGSRPASALVHAIEETFRIIARLSAHHGITEGSSLNIGLK